MPLSLKTLVAAIAAAYYVAACGGADAAAPATPTVRWHFDQSTAKPTAYVLFWMDDAEMDDYLAVTEQFDASWVAEPQGLLLSASGLTDAQARTLLFNELQSYAFAVRRLR
jgi:hypothetical protein